MAIRRHFLWFVLLIAFAAACTADEATLPGVDLADLPPRSTPESLPMRPTPAWTRTHCRIGHLPGSLAMSEAFIKSGYDVVTLNALGRWDIVGPTAKLYPPE